jgi:hypothetical protein
VLRAVAYVEHDETAVILLPRAWRPSLDNNAWLEASIINAHVTGNWERGVIAGMRIWEESTCLPGKFNILLDRSL